MTTTATTSSTATATTSTVASIVQTLGSGSGVDTVKLVQQLVEAQFAVKNSQLAAKADTLTAQISAVSALKSELTNFDGALKSLVTSGSLTTQPTSSNSAVVAVSATAGARLAGLSGQFTVNQLASAQAATTNTAIPRTTAFNAGTLTLRFGTDTTAGDPPVTTFTPGNTAFDIAIGAGDATLDGIAAKINAANKGVTATVVTDGIGARLTIKGATGALQAFSLTGADTDPNGTGASLSTLDVGRGATGTTIGTSAADASVTLDGATFRRSTNTITDLISGVKLELGAVSTTPVTLGATAPTSALSSAVNDFVATFNQLQKIVATDIDPFTGVLRSDPTVTAISRSLAKLTTETLATPTATGAPRTLADLGVTTNRDGSLAVDSTKLASAITKYPDAVEALFAFGKGGASNDGISGALSAIVKQATVANPVADRDLSLNASTKRLTAAQADIVEAQSKAADLAVTTKTRMTAQFSKMDSAVAAYKSTQAFLTQQIDAWNNSDN
ncbi:MAG: flagellar hook protein [Sphingomonas sp.]|nr:MAG: flagellar hook protein [Sphingomonas sp.]